LHALINFYGPLENRWYEDAMIRRSSRRKAVVFPEISLTPLIDTTLVLLVIFMVAAPLVHNSLKVDLPYGKKNEVGSVQKDITVYIDKKHTLFINDVAVSSHQLIDEIKKRVAQYKDPVVFIQADRDISYGAVFELVDKIKDMGGVEYVALDGQRPKTS